MSYFLNLVFYNLFKFEKTTQEFFTYPILLLLRSNKAEGYFKKKGITNPEKELIKTNENPQVGISSILSGGHFIVLYFLIIFGAINFISGCFRIEFNLELTHFVIMAILSYGFAYWFSFRQDRYLEYFKKFGKQTRRKKIVSAWMAFFIVFGIWTFCIGSFIFLNYRL
jgi:hypothetical protein